MSRVPQQGPQQDALTQQDWLTLDRIEQTLTTIGAITADDAKWLIEQLTKLAKAAAVVPSPSAQPTDATGQGRLLLNAYGRACYEAGKAAVSSSSVADSPLGCLLAYGESESMSALVGKDREQYQFWEGWVAALRRASASSASAEADKTT